MGRWGAIIMKMFLSDKVALYYKGPASQSVVDVIMVSKPLNNII